MEIREGETRKKISNTEKKKRDEGEKERVLEGRKAERKKRRQQIWNENEVRTEISSEKGKMQGAVEPRKKERS